VTAQLGSQFVFLRVPLTQSAILRPGNDREKAFSILRYCKLPFYHFSGRRLPSRVLRAVRAENESLAYRGIGRSGN
jgi:hypothetical protein